LRLEVGICCELEDRTGQAFDVLTQRITRGRVTEARWLLWAAVQPYHADTLSDPDIVGKLTDTVGGARALRSVLHDLLTLNADDDPPKESELEKATKVPDEPGSLWRRLFVDARAHGMTGEQFWKLSLCELWRERAAIRKRHRLEVNRDKTLAWYIANLVWARTLPRLDVLIGDQSIRPKRQQTWQEMKAAMMAITGTAA
jgi:hypothetical protein